MRKNIIILLIFLIVLTGSLFLFKNSGSALNAESLNSACADDIIRVGISNSNGLLEYNKTIVSAHGAFELIDEATGFIIAKSAGNGIFTIEMTTNGFAVYNSSGMIKDKITGPIEIKTQDNMPIEIIGLKKLGKPAAYRGEIKIIQSPTHSDKFSVVNFLPLNEYLRGVVPNEMPVSFGIEALKAQAIAARNYAIKPRVKTYSQFDVCDSVQCQVYFGYNTESPLSDRAVEETRGLVALYEGDLILALYSSTAGGYTENYENVFTEHGNPAFPARPIPYLRGKPDIEGTPVLNTEENALQFYSNSPVSFDNASRYYRWTRSWTREGLESQLNETLVRYYNPAFISSKLEKGATIGTLKKIEVTSRGVSGKAMAVRISASNGDWYVLKELLIRQIFKNSGSMLPSANIIFNNIYDPEGNLTSVEIIGGGIGHGVGLSQFGAGYLSKNGYTFDRILQHYYTDIAIGTCPVVLTSKNTEPITRIFYSTNQKANLIIYNPQRSDNFRMTINSNEINLSKDDLNRKRIEINLDNYVNKGLNEVVYYPPDKNKSIKVWIEVFNAINQESNSGSQDDKE